MTVDLYPWFAALSSLSLVIMFGHGVWHAARHRHFYHDDRSAYDLLLALTMFVASVGLLISALASFSGAAGVDILTRNELRNLGLALVRGVLIVTAIVMLGAGRQREIAT